MGRKDPRQILTDRIIAMLEKGGLVFRERWLRAAGRGMPRNGKTGKAYRGANVLILWDEAIEKGYSSNVWLTYKQAASLGAQVRRGERAVMCVHFERGLSERGQRVEEDRDPPADGRVQLQHAPLEGRLLCRPFWLFNVAQIAGLPNEAAALGRPPETFAGGPVEAAVRLLGGCNPTIRHGFERAMYLPDLDEIRLPLPERFTSAEAYCATSLHELVHWTGHPRRLSRCFGQRFGDSAYAFEELVAELGAAFVLGHCGLVEATIEGHAAYLESWLRVLRSDRSAIFTAARHAGDAFEFILARSMPQPGDLAAP
jgi:antirestriction protein ArdC